MEQFNDNELNNLIYVILKYTFRFEDPVNSDIAAIMSAIKHNRTRNNMVQEIVKYVKIRYGRNRLGDLVEMLRHMNFCIDEFPKLPYSIRNDLGEDKEAGEFLIKN